MNNSRYGNIFPLMIQLALDRKFKGFLLMYGMLKRLYYLKVVNFEVFVGRVNYMYLYLDKEWCGSFLISQAEVAKRMLFSA